MMKENKTDKFVRTLDLNDNGRLESSEFVKVIQQTFRRASLQSVAHGTAGSTELKTLEGLSEKELRSDFEEFRQRYSGLYPQGVETPKDADFQGLVDEAHKTARTTKEEIATGSVVGRALAYAQLAGEDLRLGFEALLTPVKTNPPSRKDGVR